MTVPDVLIVTCYLVIAGSHAAKYWLSGIAVMGPTI